MRTTFQPLTIEGPNYHIQRCGKELEHSLYIPLLVTDPQGYILLQDQKTVELHGTGACMTFPFLKLGKNIGRKTRFGKSINRFVRNKIFTQEQDFGTNIEAFGYYKDYVASDFNGSNGPKVTILPALVGITGLSEPKPSRKFRYFNGITTWVTMEECQEIIEKQVQIIPENNLALDTFDIVQLLCEKLVTTEAPTEEIPKYAPYP